MNIFSRLLRTAGRARIVIIALIVIIIALLAVIFMPRGRVEAPTSEQVASTTPSKITVNASKQTHEQASYIVEVETPVVSGMADEIIQKKINAALASKIKDIVDDFENQAVHTPVTSGADTKSGLGIEMASSNIVKNRVLTIRLTILTYFSGAAHPITLSETSNFDLKTGVDISNLIDIFDTTLGTDYLSAISDYSIKSLKKSLAEMQGVPEDSKELVFFEEGANSNPENFQNFIIEDTGIRFIFTQYQVAPYAAGEQEVLIPYSLLKKFMKEGELKEALTR